MPKPALWPEASVGKRAFGRSQWWFVSSGRCLSCCSQCGAAALPVRGSSASRPSRPRREHSKDKAGRGIRQRTYDGHAKNIIIFMSLCIHRGVQLGSLAAAPSRIVATAGWLGTSRRADFCGPSCRHRPHRAGLRHSVGPEDCECPEPPARAIDDRHGQVSAIVVPALPAVERREIVGAHDPDEVHGRETALQECECRRRIGRAEFALQSR